jgi:hypothetical protein
MVGAPDSDCELELEALQIVIPVWVIRDIQFRILEATLTDSKRKPLSNKRIRRRHRAWQEFEAAIQHGNGFDEPAQISLTAWPWASLKRALPQVPKGNDRHLVEAAVDRKVRVFITRDHNVLKAEYAMRNFGLLITSPQHLLRELEAAGALHALARL